MKYESMPKIIGIVHKSLDEFVRLTLQEKKCKFNVSSLKKLVSDYMHDSKFDIYRYNVFTDYEIVDGKKVRSIINIWVEILPFSTRTFKTPEWYHVHLQWEVTKIWVQDDTK